MSFTLRSSVVLSLFYPLSSLFVVYLSGYMCHHLRLSSILAARPLSLTYSPLHDQFSSFFVSLFRLCTNTTHLVTYLSFLVDYRLESLSSIYVGPTVLLSLF